MFKINPTEIPILQTRKALLVIDLQKDLIDDAGAVPTSNPPKLIQNVQALVPIFRKMGKIIWITSQYEQMRPINNGSPASENIILNKQVEAARAAAYLKGRVTPAMRQPAFTVQRRPIDAMEEEPESNPDCLDVDGSDDAMDFDNFEDEQADILEAFLTVLPGSKSALNIGLDKPIALLEVLQRVSTPDDIYFTKSYYSAFNCGALIQTLRKHLITELFICGALSNTSVFATAMDAAMHGIQITLVEDCLGFRGPERHNCALSLLDEATGCDIFNSNEVIADIEKSHSRSTSRRPVRDQESEEIADMLGMLKLNDKPSMLPSNDKKGEVNNLPAGPSIPGNNLGLDDDSSVIPHATRTAVMNGKPRVESKIVQRREIEKSETRETAEAESNTPLSSEKQTDATGASTAEKQTPCVVEHSPSIPKSGGNENKDGKNDLQTHSVNSVDEKEKTSTTDPPETISDDTSCAATSPLADPSGMSRREEGQPLCEGDTVVIINLLQAEEAGGIFEKLKDEVQWQRMSHQGGEVPRLVAVQGEIGADGEIPVYRHPADESPPLLAFSPTVSLIRREVEKATVHAVNHCLIQFYRDGKDYISEHSDKTLDIVPNTYIANVSLGAERAMVFRGKRDPKVSDSTSASIKPRNTVRASLPHNSMMRMGLKTNVRWMHSIRQDKRREAEKTPAELDFGGCRISLTFRLIGTFLSRDQSRIWGQGAVAKDKEGARSVVNGPTDEAKKMVEAFGIENRSSEFGWQNIYGKGFDVLHMSNDRKLLLSGNKLVDDGVVAMLAHLGLSWVPSSITAPAKADAATPEEPLIKLIDTDISRSTVQGHAAILLYLDAVHGKRQSRRTPFECAKLYTRLNTAINLAVQNGRAIDLNAWETYAAEDVYVGGPQLSIVDFAFFPALHSVLIEMSDEHNLPKLKAYRERMIGVDAIKKVLDTTKHDVAGA